MATEPARAKVNLALHVTGLRSDGYHLLDSIVAFAETGDAIGAETADTLTLSITGPFGVDLSTTDNLVLRAARALHPTRGAHITLTKNLPVASGIGGGSADAAATLRLLSRLWSVPLPNAQTVLKLGADVPVCLNGHAARMQGIGDRITPFNLPKAWLVLVNPGVALSTAAVFGALQNRTNAALSTPQSLHTAADLAAYLHAQRNDLEPPAQALAPAITAALNALSAQPGCLLSRMSGSGATCFGLFATEPAATFAARALHSAHPQWWTAATPLR